MLGEGENPEALEKLVDVGGLEPPTPCLQSKQGEKTKSFVWCRLHGKPAKFSLSQLSLSYPEFGIENREIRGGSLSLPKMKILTEGEHV